MCWFAVNTDAQSIMRPVDLHCCHTTREHAITNLLKIDGILQHHGLLTRHHLRANVVVEVGMLLQYHSIAIKAMSHIHLVHDVLLYAEPQSLQLPHLSTSTWSVQLQ